MKKTIVIADDNAGLLTGLKDYFANSATYEVVATAQDGIEALAQVKRYSPDFLLLDIVMPELDGFGVLTALTVKPVTIVMSQLGSDGFVQKALQYGASYFLAKPFSFDRLTQFMDGYNQLEQTTAELHVAHQDERARYLSPAPAIKDRSLDEKIANIFLTVGIPAHIKGYQFLREAIKMAVDEPEIINAITKKLYPSIATHFDTSASKVERAIRHAIEVAWNRGKIENINAIFGIKVYSANEKPTNGEFIALVADKMLLEGA